MSEIKYGYIYKTTNGLVLVEGRWGNERDF
jgi:hypothetical protein